MSETITFRCECGSSLSAPRAKAGGKGKCQRCGKVVPIPSVSEPAPRGAPADKSPGEPSSSATCGICQTALRPTDEVTHCNACQLPFHVECWLENFGCSAYGCRNVNVLKTATPTYAAAGAGQANAPTMLSHPAGSSAASAMRPGLLGGDFPWEYILLVISGIGVLFGLVSFGVISLAFGVFAGVAYAFGGKGKSPLPFVACVVISLLGFVVGAIVSWFMYF